MINAAVIGTLAGGGVSIGDLEFTMYGAIMRNNNVEAWTMYGFWIM